jgi:hypothetical protein
VPNLSIYCFLRSFLAIYLRLALGSWDSCRLRCVSRVLSWLRIDEAGPRPPSDLREIKHRYFYISFQYFLNSLKARRIEYCGSAVRIRICDPLLQKSLACRNMYLIKTIF